MSPNPYQDPNFLRRQREKRDADKKTRATAEARAAQSQLSSQNKLTPLTRQQAIDAKIQELLDKQPPPTPPSSQSDN